MLCVETRAFARLLRVFAGAEAPQRQIYQAKKILRRTPPRASLRGSREAQNARIGANRFAPAAFRARATLRGVAARANFAFVSGDGARRFAHRWLRARSEAHVRRFLQQIVDGLRVGFAAGCLHHLADEPADCFRIGLGVADLVGILGDDVVDELFDRRNVGHLLKSARFDDPRGSPPSVQTISKTSLAILPEMVPSAIRSRIAPSCASLTGSR